MPIRYFSKYNDILSREQWDQENISVNQLSTLFHMLVDMVVSEEETQIHGLKPFVDLGGVSRKLIEACSDPRFLKNHLRILQIILIMKYPLLRSLDIFVSIGLRPDEI